MKKTVFITCIFTLVSACSSSSGDGNSSNTTGTDGTTATSSTDGTTGSDGADGADGTTTADECSANTDCDRAEGEVCSEGSCELVVDDHPEDTPTPMTCDSSESGSIGNGLDVDVFTFTFDEARTINLSIEAFSPRYPATIDDELAAFNVSYVQTELDGGGGAGSWSAFVENDPTDDDFEGEAGDILEIRLSGYDATVGGDIGYSITISCTE